MSDDVALMATAVETSPAEVQHTLVSALRQVARNVAKRPEIQRGLVAAEMLKPGLVHHDEASAAAAADAVLQVIAAEKYLKSQLDLVLSIPKQMIESVRLEVAQEVAALDSAKKVANGARVAWQMEQQRLAAAAEAKAKREEAEAQTRAAEQAALTGEDAPPPAEIAPIVAPTMVRGGAGASLTQVRATPMEIVDDAACPPELKLINAPAARSAWKLGELTKKVPKLKGGESFVYKGIRFEGVMTAVNKGA